MRVTGAVAAVDLDDLAADPEAAYVDWWRWRRRHRLAGVHWIDALYQAYLAALIVGAAVLFGATLIGDEPVRATRALAEDGEALLGLAVAALVGVGLRSGSRGGPLALDQADVRHVLLAPVDRSVSLRGAAFRQLRFLLFAAAATGATAGHLADRRLSGNGGAWTACGAVAAVVAVGVAYGAACVAAGLRVRPWVATAIAVGLVALAAADVADRLAWSPSAAVGAIAVWPIRVAPESVGAVGAAGALAVAGLQAIAGVSIERLERRSRLVGQIRFAATLQDLRTVVVLRRQLTQERARTRPWLSPPLPRRRLPIVTRDIRSLLRWPIGRIARLGLLAVVAGVSARAAYDGTTPLIVVAGLALFLAGLDAAEPLGQDLDHPTRRDTIPRPAGWIHAWHLPAILAVSLGVALAAAAVAVAVDPVDGAWPVALACVPAAGMGAAAGAVVNLLMGAPDPAGTASSAWNLAPPEAAGVGLVYRTGWPPTITVLGASPAIAARDHGADAALLGAAGLAGLFALVVGWARFRNDIKAWWRAQTESLRPPEVAT